MRKLLLIGLFVLLAGWPAGAAPPDWSAWKFLMGHWTAVGPPDQGTGSFTLEPDVQSRVLVRRSQADYAPNDKVHAPHHEDLMVVYQTGNDTRADYFDNEGHVIHYAVTVVGGSATFLSDLTAGAPRFRLTYVQQAPDTVAISFDIAFPDHPDDFHKYAASTARRQP